MKIVTSRIPLLLLVLSLACEPDPPGGAEGDGAPAAGAGGTAFPRELPPPPRDPAVARWSALLSDSLRHRSGACPFECCVYRTWTPTGMVPLREEPRRSLPVFHRIPAGQSFQADSGFVRVTGVSLVAVAERVDAESGAFGAGDTLVVLDYVGEGRWNVWDGRRVQEVTGFWGAEAPTLKAALIGGAEYAREWWVHASTREGVRGWFEADSVARLAGADACGG